MADYIPNNTHTDIKRSLESFHKVEFCRNTAVYDRFVWNKVHIKIVLLNNFIATGTICTVQITS